jgi:hypothetical protein
LVPSGGAPDAAVVSQVRTGLEHCTERDAAGRPQLRFTLPDEGALAGLATTLAKLLVAK